MPAEMTKDRPLAEQPRLLEFDLNGDLQNIIQNTDTQVINLIGGGNVPESIDTLVRIISPTPEGSDPKQLTPEQEYLKELLPTLDDLPWHIYDKLRAYNDDGKNEKKIRVVDTTARIKAQYLELRESIEGLVREQMKTKTKNIVFTVCGASPPDLQFIRVIQDLNVEYAGRENMPQLYAAIFLPGDEEGVIDYSVRAGLHSKFWEQVYRDAQNDPNIFIHEPKAARGLEESLEDRPGHVVFKKLRATSTEKYAHNRGGNVDINRTLTEIAGRPPIWGYYLEGLHEAKQFLGSGLELIGRHLWLLHHHGLSFDEAFASIKILQHGFFSALPWTESVAKALFARTKSQYDGEANAGIWPRRQHRRSLSTWARITAGRIMEERYGVLIDWDNGSRESVANFIRGKLRRAPTSQ